MDFQKKYGKILLPLITPYDENEEIDYGKYAELIEYVITNDLCDSLIVTGTTGEASLLTFDERVKLFETAVKASAGRKPVIAGTGCASTKETIALTNKAYDLGIELALIVCPFYNKPTQEGLYLHYKTIAENTKANIMLYNIPIFVGVNLEAETVGRLAAIPNIVGVKDEAGVNPTQVTDFFLATEKVDPNFVVYNGDDIMLLPTIVQGAMGIVSGARPFVGSSKITKLGLCTIACAIPTRCWYPPERLLIIRLRKCVMSQRSMARLTASGISFVGMSRKLAQ